MSTQPGSQNKHFESNTKGLHVRNIHRQSYDFAVLTRSYPPLALHVTINAYSNHSINFADPLAVKALNTALLKHHYRINNWTIPEGALCPPIPGRVDYIHHIAELLGCSELSIHKTEAQPAITMLDIGTGANGIYPLLAGAVYGWQCVGSDISEQSLDNVASIIDSNPELKDSLELRHQLDKNCIFNGIIKAEDYFDVTVCNPPFHASEKEAVNSSQRKRNNLARNRNRQVSSVAEQNKTDNHVFNPLPTLNFGGQAAELWCKGGERAFLRKLIKESELFRHQCRWFTSLVSKADNVKSAKKLMHKLGATKVQEIDMKQGHKITRILAWTYT